MPNLAIQTLLPAAAALVFTFVGRTEGWMRLPNWAHQLIYGVSFGLVAVVCSETGVSIVDGGVMSLRDAGPVVAGLAFGGPAGIIAGLIAGIERWCSVMWGGGYTTQFACSLAAVIAGIGAAAMRRFIFENRTPITGYGIAIGVTTEVLHMLLILLTNATSVSIAFQYVSVCTFPMVGLTGLAVGLALIGRGYINHEALLVRPPHLISDLGLRLFLAVFSAFIVVTTCAAWIAVSVTTTQAGNILNIHLADAEYARDVFGWGVFVGDVPVWRIQENGAVLAYEVDTGELLSPTTFYDYSVGLNVYDGNFFEQSPAEFEDYTLYTTQIAGVECYVMRSGAVTDGRVMMAYVPEAESDYAAEYLLYLTIYLEILVNDALFIILFQLMRFRVVRNLECVEDGLEKITAGDLDTHIDVRTHYEFNKLSNNINTTVDALKGYIEEAEHRRDAELAMARQIQHSALPNVFPPFPERADFDLYASMDAAREVGGDFYDFFLLNNHTLVVLIADVSGKGVPAALFMMQAKTEIHALMESGMEVDEAFTETNRRLCESNDSGMFVTAWLGKFDFEVGHLSYANAGHNPPLLRRPRGQWAYLKDERPNMVLAGMDGIRYRKHELNIEPDTKLYLYTDGVTEAYNPQDELYGEERLLDKLNSIEGRDPHALCDSVLASIREHANGAEQSDDITMLAVDVRALRGRNHIMTDASLDSIDLMVSFFEERLPRINVGARTANRVQVIVDETYSNICHYSGATHVVASVLRKGADLIVEFADDGVAFDPTQQEEPDLTLSADDRPIGGLGIHMMRKMTRSIEYQRVDDTNILTFTFALDG